MNEKKVGLLFPGYGSQFVGMGKDIYDSSRLMQEYFEEASNCLNVNFVKLCFASSDLELARIDHAFPALFLISSSIASIIIQMGVQPVAIAGYGLGEYAALQTAGSLSLPDGLYFLTKYANSYQQILDETSLRAVRVQGVPASSLKKWCKAASTGDQLAAISAYHDQDDHVVAGTSEAVTLVADQAQEIKAKLKEYPVEAGMHSKLMQLVVESLHMYAEKIDFKDATMPVIAGIDGMARTDGALIGQAVLQQIIQPIRWDKVMAHIGAWDIVLEIGPGNTLSSFVKKAMPDKPMYTIGKQADIEALKDVLALEPLPVESDES